jgi:hypothetical protein
MFLTVSHVRYFKYNDVFRTFTGKSGYVTVIPVPTAVVTIEIAAEFGGGAIHLGIGGLIVGSLPPESWRSADYPPFLGLGLE